MEIDPETGIEGALDHAFRMDLKYLGRGEATHQRRTHLPRIGSRLRRKDQRFAHRLDVQSDDYLIDHLACLTVADSTGMGNILTHHFKKRSGARESLFGSPHMMYTRWHSWRPLHHPILLRPHSRSQAPRTLKQNAWRHSAKSRSCRSPACSRRFLERCRPPRTRPTRLPAYSEPW